MRVQAVKGFSRILTDETLRERAAHGSAAFPFQYYLEDVWGFDLHRVDWHWHPEVEFVRVRTGEVRCAVGSERTTLRAGWGLFVNSRAVHRFEADAPALMPNMVFSPALLAPEESLVYRRCIQPVLTRGAPCLAFDPGVEWQARALAQMDEIFALWEGGDPSPLATLRELLALWEGLCGHMALVPVGAEDGNSARLQVMMQFIHERYAEPITLEDIAASVYVSKSSALQIFRNGIHASPVAYLVQYRLRQAALLLRTTQMGVAAVAAETGFSDAGYFCRRFRDLFGMSPGAYRREKRREWAERAESQANVSQARAVKDGGRDPRTVATRDEPL